LFGWAEPSFANIYVGIAERARDLVVARVKEKKSVAMTRSMAYHPEVQHTIAEIVLAIEGMIPHVDRIAEDWSNGVDHGDQWPAKLVAAKYHCVESAFRVVDLAMEVSGGRGMFKGDELERLYRDVRCGRFHPANSMVVHEVIGKSALGILGEEGLRWGGALAAGQSSVLIHEVLPAREIIERIVVEADGILVRFGTAG
jgi:alkylation response protein AidB-like acyl-CoA dehydrogenase